ncbi:TPA: sce7726 family protein [Klebsiella quasipneumoniae subsp. similipneumoniae]
MNSKEKMLESAIKALVIKNIFQKENNATAISNNFVIDEFSVANFSRRVDLIHSRNDKIFAYEIKSEFDSLSRLKGQVDEYLTHFDKVTVVAAPRHIDKALLLTPKNVAVWEVAGSKLKIVRRGKILPITDKMKFIRMMTLIELLSLAKKSNIEIKDKKRKIVELSLLSIPTKYLREEAINNLKIRYSKRELNYYDANNYNNYGQSGKAEPRKKILQTRNIDSLIHAIEKL